MYTRDILATFGLISNICMLSERCLRVMNISVNKRASVQMDRQHSLFFMCCCMGNRLLFHYELIWFNSAMFNRKIFKYYHTTLVELMISTFCIHWLANFKIANMNISCTNERSSKASRIWTEMPLNIHKSAQQYIELCRLYSTRISF